ncbi:alpha/beta fold hydrolase [Novosphingobium sp. Gsoil 351]|uniref:alpha/beta fold hydrolase n=1 Tax=Novosphingobium sp. Gsoil 351 TaxID=2675225 RepID=UPI0021059207|nr:alpha/beta hydrolase [Novosphingobium sp. Gsoil 351]
MTVSPPLLLIPGNMCDARLWQPVARLLEEDGHRVQMAPRLDQPSIGEMADAVLAAAQGPLAAAQGPLIAVGFSMGAIVAAEMARRAPRRIAALGLIAFNAAADLPVRAAVRPRQQAAVKAGELARIVAEELKPNYLAAANQRDGALLDLVMEMAEELGAEAFVSQSEALRQRDDLRSSLSQLQMPVLLACGSEDRLCPPDWHRAWAAAIGPRARCLEIAGAGHLVPLERPQPLADALLGWLAEETLCPTAS